jgi:hypothetical protein
MSPMLKLPDIDLKRFHLFWLLIIGGILELFDAYTTGREVLRLGEQTLAKFQAEGFALGAAVMGLTREFMPVQVGVMLAWLSPVIGTFEYLKIKKADVSEAEKRKLLLLSRIKSLILATPVLIVLGLSVSIGFAYWASSGQQYLSALHPIEDFSVSIGKGLIFGGGLGLLGLIQIRAFFKWPKIAPVILVSILVVILNLAAIIFLDYGVIKLLY